VQPYIALRQAHGFALLAALAQSFQETLVAHLKTGAEIFGGARF
jgi:hypothetical protein